jgi:ligand-binding sensor domain-containing protein
MDADDGRLWMATANGLINYNLRDDTQLPG